jgi:DNA-binding NarL/FixJ family response regulator
MIDGAHNKAIARALAIGEHAAKFHIAAILPRLHARNRGEAVGTALRDGLVRL